MARFFDDVQSEYLGHAAAIVSAYPLTMAAWVYTDAHTSANQTILAVLDDSSPNYYHSLRIAGWRANIRAESYDGGWGTASSASGPDLDSWHHACGVFTAATARAAFIDGGGKGTNSTDITPTGLGATRIARRVADYMSGRIAEAAIWNVALTDEEVAILGAGYSPLFVRPQNLVAYWPLIRDEDQDRIGGYDMTAYNAPSIATHPPVIYPALVFIGVGAEAAAEGNPWYYYAQM